MAEPRVDNSCQKWRTILSAHLPKPCTDCYTPHQNQICLECKPKFNEDKPQAAGEEEEPDPCQPVPKITFRFKVEEIRRKIDTKALCDACNKGVIKNPGCNLCNAQEAVFKNNLCSTECRPLKTLLHLQEVDFYSIHYCYDQFSSFTFHCFSSQDGLSPRRLINTLFNWTMRPSLAEFFL